MIPATGLHRAARDPDAFSDQPTAPGIRSDWRHDMYPTADLDNVHDAERTVLNLEEVTGERYAIIAHGPDAYTVAPEADPVDSWE